MKKTEQHCKVKIDDPENRYGEHISTVDNLAIRQNVLYVDLWYPRNEPLNVVELGIMDVRAADSIRIEYDFERDGYSIKQASTFEWDMDDKECDSDWQEVAFIQAWAREKKADTSNS